MRFNDFVREAKKRHRRATRAYRPVFWLVIASITAARIVRESQPRLSAFRRQAASRMGGITDKLSQIAARGRKHKSHE
jgi:hypothetical protein